MNRIKDYAGFAIWFSGLGYIALWPVASPDLNGKPFGAAIFCPDVSPGVLDMLCNSAHRLQLPAGLHALGCLSTLLVTIRLLQYAVKRSRRAVGNRAADMSALTARLPSSIPPPRRKPSCPLRPVKARSHFGLRGVPH